MQSLLLSGFSQYVGPGRQEVKDIDPEPSAIKRASKVRYPFVMIPTMEIFTDYFTTKAGQKHLPSFEYGNELLSPLALPSFPSGILNSFVNLSLMLRASFTAGRILKLVRHNFIMWPLFLFC